MNEDRIIKQIFSQAFTDYTLCLSDNGDLVKIGEGGSGVVYQATRNRDGRNTAVKVTGLKTLIVPGEDLDKAVLTIKMQQKASVQNPSVLAIDDFYVIGADIDENDCVKHTVHVNTDTDSYIGGSQLHGSEQILIFSFMENMEGILKRDKAKTGACLCNNELLNCIGRDGRRDLAGSPDGVLFLAYDTACALRDLKAENVAHRDVKPDNIFYDPANYRFLLGDFGLARIAEDAAASTHAGTNGFLAPEIRIGIGEYDPYCGDIYALGMTMYSLMNGLALPGQKTGMLRTNPIADIQYGRDSDDMIPEPRNGFPQINKLIKKMIATDPKARPGIDEVLMSLENIAMDFGIYNLDDAEYRQVDSMKIIRLPETEDNHVKVPETADTGDYNSTGKRITDITYVKLPGRFLDHNKAERKIYPTAAQVILVILGIIGMVTIDSHLHMNTDAYILPSLVLLLSSIFGIYKKSRFQFFRSMNTVFPVITLILAVVCVFRHEMNWQTITAIFAVLLSYASADIGLMLTLSVIAYEFIGTYSIHLTTVADKNIWLIFTSILFIALMLLFLNEKFIKGAEIKEIRGSTCIDCDRIVSISIAFILIMFASGIAAAVFLVIYIVHIMGKMDMPVFIRLMRPQAAFGIAAVVSLIMVIKLSFETNNEIKE